MYQKSLEFQDTVYKTTLPYPPDERFNLVSQFRRASLSLSLNSYIDQKQRDAIRADMVELKKMICGLINYLRKSVN